jgi:hypothetical protein
VTMLLISSSDFLPTEISPLGLVGWMELSRSKFYEWRDRYGKANEHNVLVPRDHWLEEWEKERRMPPTTSTIGSRWRAIAGLLS